MTLDVTALRADTPSCQDQSFLDNAGSALSPTVVNDAVISYLRDEQRVGGYLAAQDNGASIWGTITSIAQLVGVTPQRVALTSSATAAWNRAISSIEFVPGDRVLTTRAEYASNVLPLLQAHRRNGISVEFIPDGPDGVADPAAFADMLDERVKAVAITHAPSQNGLLVNAAEFGRALREADSSAWYLLDACQSVGQVAVPMDEIGADFVTATGRKWLRGPRGTGFLTVSDRVLDSLEPYPIDMCGATWQGGLDYRPADIAMRFQSFEMSYAGVVGLGAAVDYALGLGIGAIRDRVNLLATQLRTDLDSMPRVRTLDRGSELTGIVTFALPHPDSVQATAQLRTHGVTVTPVGPATNPDEYVEVGETCILRASPHVYNTPDDLAALCSAIDDLLR